MKNKYLSLGGLAFPSKELFFCAGLLFAVFTDMYGQTEVNVIRQGKAKEEEFDDDFARLEAAAEASGLEEVNIRIVNETSNVYEDLLSAFQLTPQDIHDINFGEGNKAYVGYANYEKKRRKTNLKLIVTEDGGTNDRENDKIRDKMVRLIKAYRPMKVNGEYPLENVIAALTVIIEEDLTVQEGVENPEYPGEHPDYDQFVGQQIDEDPTEDWPYRPHAACIGLFLLLGLGSYIYARKHGNEMKESSERIKTEIDVVMKFFAQLEKKITWVHDHIEHYQSYLTAGAQKQLGEAKESFSIVTRDNEYAIEEGGWIVPRVASSRQKTHAERLETLKIMKDTVAIFEQVYETMITIKQLENLQTVVGEGGEIDFNVGEESGLLAEANPLIDVTRLGSFEQDHTRIIETNTPRYVPTEHNLTFTSWEEVLALHQKMDNDLDVFFTSLAYFPGTISEEDGITDEQERLEAIHTFKSKVLKDKADFDKHIMSLIGLGSLIDDYAQLYTNFLTTYNTNLESIADYEEKYPQRTTLKLQKSDQDELTERRTAYTTHYDSAVEQEAQPKKNRTQINTYTKGALDNSGKFLQSYVSFEKHETSFYTDKEAISKLEKTLKQGDYSDEKFQTSPALPELDASCLHHQKLSEAQVAVREAEVHKVNGDLAQVTPLLDREKLSNELSQYLLSLQNKQSEYDRYINTYNTYQIKKQDVEDNNKANVTLGEGIGIDSINNYEVTPGLTNWYEALKDALSTLNQINEEQDRLLGLKKVLDDLATDLGELNTTANGLSSHYLSGFSGTLTFSLSVSGTYDDRKAALESRISILTSNILSAESYIRTKKREEQEEQDKRDQEAEDDDGGRGYAGDSDAGL